MNPPRSFGKISATLSLLLAVAFLGFAPVRAQTFSFYSSGTTVGSSSLDITVNGFLTGNALINSGNTFQGSGNLVLEAGNLVGNPGGGDLILNGVDSSTGNIVVLNGNLEGIQVSTANLTFVGVTFNLTDSSLTIGNVGFNGSNNVTNITVGSGSVYNLSSNSAGNSSLNITNNGTLDGSGNFSGNATVNGTLMPGSSGNAGLVSIGSNLTLGSNNTTDFQVSGNTRGTQYSALDVGGNLSLNGTLAVSLVNNYTPALGTIFDFIQAGSIAGDFAAVVLPTINANLSWDTSQLATNGDIEVGAINFAQWTSDAGLSGNAALAAAKPFTGGPANLIRYAMNLGTAVAPPNVPQPTLATINGVPCETIQYRVRKNMTDYTLVPQSSTDLINWTNVDAGNITQLTDADAYTSLFQAAVALPPNGMIFLRVVAQ